MKLRILERLAAEVVHFYEPSTDTIIYSRGNVLWVRRGSVEASFIFPLPLSRKPFIYSRMARRALRLDKMNAVFTADRDAVVAFYGGAIYRCDLRTGAYLQTGKLLQCRNVLHCGVCVAPWGAIYFGEYGHNAERAAVPIWMSIDDGRSWRKIYEFPSGSIKHVHGVYFDPFTDKLWIPTGDFANECFLVEANRDFSDVKYHGDGTQEWRPVSLFFERDHIVWGMDSQLQTSMLQIFDRKTQTITAGQAFPGPVWYSKRLNGLSILQTTCEIGAGVQSDSGHLFVSRDNRTWIEVAKFRKDVMPMRYFKFGVIAFADGDQSFDRFAMFGEALRGFDGVSFIAAIE